MTLTTTRQRIDTTTWAVPQHLTTRGTVFVITGRGEPPEVYDRFGQRLAADAYRTVVISAANPFDSPTRAEIAELTSIDTVGGVRVIAGSDLGAWAALDLAGELAADAVIAAGLAVAGATEPKDWQDEIAARTACPTHTAVLIRSARGSLFAQSVAPLALRPPELPRLDVPVLALHGADDTIAPLDRAVKQYRGIGVDEVITVRGGRHDILNDVSHRSVAARIVIFLEQLRLGPDQALVLEPVRP